MTAENRSVLESTAFLQLVPQSDRQRVVEGFTELHYGFGEVITAEGDPADAFFILTSGRARVFKRGEGDEEVPLNTLQAGAEFGEIGLLDGGRRVATVRCSTEVTLARLDREGFRRLLREVPALEEALRLLARQRSLHNFLRQVSGFRRLPFPVLRALLERMELVQVPAESRIIQQGDGPGPMYVIQRGRVRVFRETEDGTRDVAFLRDGDFFGELSVLAGAPRAATVESLSECTLLSLTSEALRSLMESSPELRALLEERRAEYRAMNEARVPEEFSEELLPADASRHDKLRLPGGQGGESPEDEEEAESPFAGADGLFAGRRRRIRRFTPVSQVDEMDCGAAALAMVCRHFGRRVSLARVRQLTHTAWDGTSLMALCRGAEALGLAAGAFKVSRSNLDRLPLPAIVHWEGNHWVVLFAVGPRWVRVADPGLGIRRLAREEFFEKWSGYAAIFEPTKSFNAVPEKSPSLAWVLPFFRASGRALAVSLVLAVLATGLQLAFPVLTQVIVDRVVVGGATDLLGLIILGLGAALVLMLAAGLVQRYLLSRVAVRLDTSILDFLSRKLLELPMSYFNRRRTGDVQRRLAGAREVREFIVQSGIGGLLALIELAAYLSLMAVYSWKLFLLYLCTVPLYALLMLFSRRVLRPLFASLEESYGRYSSRQIDAIRGIEAVKAAAAESAFRENILTEFVSLARKQQRGHFTAMSYDSAVQAVGLLGNILFLWVGAGMAIRGQLSIGTFVAFNALVAMALGPVMIALGLWDRVQVSAVLLDRLDDVFETEPEQGGDRSGLLAVPRLRGRVELTNVGFRYGGPEAASILTGITLEVPAGRTVAIVGRSGSGKTTLAKCLAGLIEPTEGSIRYDGVELTSLDYRQLRRQVGTVLQQNYMFDATIKGNIAFGDPDPDLEKVVRAARMANAHDFIRQLPLGYETRIGESGLLLSGGQQQRIAIARALYGDPPILIFDEATSALDTESERAIQESMSTLLVGRTAFVIAHRLSTIRNADLIVVLEKGRIAERGTHEELMERRGLYHYMCSQQIGA
jgi:HlyB family type I secretion system ABC transporter